MLYEEAFETIVSKQLLNAALNHIKPYHFVTWQADDSPPPSIAFDWIYRNVWYHKNEGKEGEKAGKK